MTELIERVPEQEARAGIVLEALYAYRDSGWVHVNGEAKARMGTRLPEAFEITINFFDAAGRMLGSIIHYGDGESGMAFEPFSVLEDLDEDAVNVKRIRVFPKRAA